MHEVLKQRFQASLFVASKVVSLYRTAELSFVAWVSGLHSVGGIILLVHVNQHLAPLSYFGYLNLLLDCITQATELSGYCSKGKSRVLFGNTMPSYHVKRWNHGLYLMAVLFVSLSTYTSSNMETSFVILFCRLCRSEGESERSGAFVVDSWNSAEVPPTLSPVSFEPSGPSQFLFLPFSDVSRALGTFTASSSKSWAAFRYLELHNAP